MPESIEVYQNFNTLEWCNKYYIQAGNTNPSATIANTIRDFQKPLQTTNITYTRWRRLSGTGTLIAEGAMTGAGTATGEMMPIHYAMLIRLIATTEVGRPSVKYIHGWSENWQSGNILTSGAITALTNMGVAVLAAGLANSNGNVLENVVFRGFSRRRRIRIMGT